MIWPQEFECLVYLTFAVDRTGKAVVGRAARVSEEWARLGW